MLTLNRDMDENFVMAVHTEHLPRTLEILTLRQNLITAIPAEAFRGLSKLQRM